MNRIEILLKQYGPMLSGDLAKKYEKKYNASNEAARKAISRARSPIQKIKYFPFEKNQIFCYLEEQYNTSSYKKMLYSSLKKHSSTIAPLLIALLLQPGSGILRYPVNCQGIVQCHRRRNSRTEGGCEEAGAGRSVSSSVLYRICFLQDRHSRGSREDRIPSGQCILRTGSSAAGRLLGRTCRCQSKSLHMQ